MDAIKQIIGRHQRIRIALLDAVFKSFEIELTHRSFGDHRGVSIAIEFLIVGCIVIEGRSFAGMGLHAFCDRGSQYTGNKRIFREVFKVPSAQYIAMNIQGRCQPEIHIEQCHLASDDITKFIGKIRIEALSDRRTDRNSRTPLFKLFHILRFSGHKPEYQSGERRQKFHDRLRYPGIKTMSTNFIDIIILRQTQTGRAISHDDILQALV